MGCIVHSIWKKKSIERVKVGKKCYNFKIKGQSARNNPCTGQNNTKL